MSDDRGDNNVDSAGTMNDRPDIEDITETDESYPLTVRSFIFWFMVVCLGLLGTCVLVAIFLALTRGA